MRSTDNNRVHVYLEPLSNQILKEMSQGSNLTRSALINSIIQRYCRNPVERSKDRIRQLQAQKVDHGQVIRRLNEEIDKELEYLKALEEEADLKNGTQKKIPEKGLSGRVV